METLWANLSIIAIPAAIFLVALVALLISDGDRPAAVSDGSEASGQAVQDDLAEPSSVHRLDGRDLDSMDES